MRTAIPFARSTVTLVRRSVASRDAHGNDVFAETLTTVTDCLVTPHAAKETIDAADVTTNRLRLLAPATVDLSAIDAVDYLGQRYEIDGDPFTVPDWSGGVHHIEAVLKKVAG